MQEYFDIFAAKAEMRQIAVHKDVPLDLPFAQVEERHLGQLLTNLLGNAIAYTPAGGHIWLKAGADFSGAARFDLVSGFRYRLGHS
ncbi:MAG: hypothetical protein IPM39_00855 [Chloroflexi bacterium]|nr:hypothetical protein [Chloroflexota bacterium]